MVLAIADAFSRLAKLKALGVRLAIDDFSTGHSSLSYPSRLPVQALKIGSFISGIGLQRSDESILQAMVDIARSLELVSVAEGVET